MIEFIAVGQIDSINPTKSCQYLNVVLLEQVITNGKITAERTDIYVHADLLHTLTELSKGDLITAWGAYVRRKTVNKNPVHIASNIQSLGNFFPRVFGTPFLKEMDELRGKAKLVKVDLDEDKYV